MSCPNSMVLLEGVPGEGAEPRPAAIQLPAPATTGGRHKLSAGQGYSHSQDGGRGSMLKEGSGFSSLDQNKGGEPTSTEDSVCGS